MLAALRDRAIVRVLAGMGLRVGSVLALNLSALSRRQGMRTLRYTGKGGRKRERPLNHTAAQALDDYLTSRAAVAGVSVEHLTGPLFATSGRDGAPPAGVHHRGRAPTLASATTVSAFQLGISLTPVFAAAAFKLDAPITSVSWIGAALAVVTVPLIFFDRPRAAGPHPVRGT